MAADFAGQEDVVREAFGKEACGREERLSALLTQSASLTASSLPKASLSTESAAISLRRQYDALDTPVAGCVEGSYDVRVRDMREVREMLYSILIYVDEKKVAALTPAEDEDHIARHMKIQDHLRSRGKLGPAVRLESTATAKQLRTGEDGLVVDGPFAETKEQLLGFYIVDCDSDEEVLEIARALPNLGTIFEIRPVKRFFPA